jgi:hypothetical protein
MVGGIPTPLKNMKVSWDDDIPNIWKKNMFQTTKQMTFGYWLYLFGWSTEWVTNLDQFTLKKTVGSYQDCWYLSKFIHITMAPNV